MIGSCVASIVTALTMLIKRRLLMAAGYFLLLLLYYYLPPDANSFGLLLSHFIVYYGHDSAWPRCLPLPVREPRTTRTTDLTLVNLSLALLSLSLHRSLALAFRKLYSVVT
jgi:hypothetical protein